MPCCSYKAAQGAHSIWVLSCSVVPGTAMKNLGMRGATRQSHGSTCGHWAYRASLSVFCRAAEQRRHLQPAVHFPQLPSGKVSLRSIPALSSHLLATDPLPPLPTQVSPCSGWLTANETLRNLTSEVRRNGTSEFDVQVRPLAQRVFQSALPLNLV